MGEKSLGVGHHVQTDPAMKRTAFKRRTPLRPGNPTIKPRKALPKRRATPRRRPEGYSDPEFIAWIEQQPCRATGKPGPNIAHHLRHTATGAPMGARIKDDRRAITLDAMVHIEELHKNAGRFKGWSQARLQAWEDAQLAIQRSRYLAEKRDETAI